MDPIDRPTEVLGVPIIFTDRIAPGYMALIPQGAIILDQSLTYDELCEATPDGWHVDRHQSYEDTGIVLVDPPGRMDGIVLKPGHQLNYQVEDGNVVAYSTAPSEGAPSSTPSASGPPSPPDATPTSESAEPPAAPSADSTPPVSASSAPIPSATEPPEPELSRADMAEIDAELQAGPSVKAKPARSDKGATK